MTLEAIMTEIRDELKRSNDLKEKQLQDFTDISNEPAGWTQLPAEEAAKDVEEPKKAPAKKAPKRKPEQPADTESDEKDAAEQQEEPTETTAVEAEQPDLATLKSHVERVIKGKDKEKKTKLLSMINGIGAKKVSEVKPEQRQQVIDYIEELEND